MEEQLLEQIQINNEITSALYIQMCRIYDVLCIIAAKDSPEEIVNLNNLHKEGRTFCPAPLLIEDDDV